MRNTMSPRGSWSLQCRPTIGAYYLTLRFSRNAHRRLLQPALALATWLSHSRKWLSIALFTAGAIGRIARVATISECPHKIDGHALAPDFTLDN